jgi:hypothetical protein
MEAPRRLDVSEPIVRASTLSTLSTLSRYGGHIVGVGILGVPFAVSQAGVVASALCILAFCSLSLLTCWWLLEVGDRANAIQNELTRSFGQKPSCQAVVHHSDGYRSRLQPAIAFGRVAAPAAAGLREPLLGGEAEAVAAPQPDRLHQGSRRASCDALDGTGARRSDGEKRLDAYRSAYRSWRQGGHAGARDSELRKLRPLLEYEASVHRKLLPLQLVPPPRRRRDSFTATGGRAVPLGGGRLGGSGGPSPDPAGDASSLSLEGVLALPAEEGDCISRASSFSVDLKAALERSRRPSREGKVPASSPRGDAYEAESSQSRGSLIEGGSNVTLLDTWSIPRLGDMFADSSPATPAVFRARREVWSSPEQSPRSLTPDSVYAHSPLASARRLLPAAVESPREHGNGGAGGGGAAGGGVASGSESAGDGVSAGGGDCEGVTACCGASLGKGGGGVSRRGSVSAFGPRSPGSLIQRVRSLGHYVHPPRRSYQPPAIPRTGDRSPPAAPGLPDWSVPAISSLEVAQLCTLFLGGRARACWITSVCLLHVFAMWACAAIWLQTLHASINKGRPLGDPVPLPLVLLCAAVLVPASTIGGSARLQPALSAATAATSVLVIGVLAAALAVQGQGGDSQPWLVFDLPRRPPSSRPAPLRLLLDPAHLPPTSATLAFCHAIQQSVPSLRRAPGGAAAARATLRTALRGCGLLYLLLGCLTALVFGDATLPLFTLHLRSLHFSPPHAAAPAWASAVGGAIALLPIFITTAAFLLFNGVLAANLAVVLPSRLASRRLTAPLCALPPLLAAAVLTDTPTLLGLCGLPCLVTAFLIPAALQAAALRASLRRWGEAGRRTSHSTRFSGRAPALTLLGLGAALFISDTWSLLLQPLLHVVAGNALSAQVAS